MNIDTPNKVYRSNRHTVFSCQYHIIWCPKYRRKVLTEEVAIELKVVLLEVALLMQCEIIDMEIMEDHVHLLISIDPDIGVKNVVSRLKGVSANRLRKKFPYLKKKLPCMWTNSKFISTVGAVSLDVVKKYIQNQK